MAARPGLIRRFFGGLWRALDFSRRLVVNLLFLLIVAVLLIGWFSSDKPPRLQPDTALVLNIQGDVVEEYSVGAQEAAIAEALGRDRFETRLRDILAVLDGAARDPQVTRVVLVLDDMGSAGLATLREIGAALERVRGSGKPVVAWGESYTQGQYFLAAHADEVYLHPSGALLLRGVGGNRSYYKDLLDKVGVKVNTFQAGRYKSFGEPFTRTGPTPEAQEADAYLYNGLWSTWLADVERSRKLKAGSVMAAINDLPARLQAADGDIAGLAAKEKLVDGLKRRDEFRALMIQRGAPRSDDDAETFRQISMYSYLRYVDDRAARPCHWSRRGAGRNRRRRRPQGHGRGARGRRTDPAGAAGRRHQGAGRACRLARRKCECIGTDPRAARTHAQGGQAGCRVDGRRGGVRRLLDRHGGDEVVADAATITGSIGVFALVPTFAGTMEKVGVSSAGCRTPRGSPARSTSHSRWTSACPRSSRRASATPTGASSTSWQRTASPRPTRSTKWRRVGSGPGRRPRSADWSMNSADWIWR